jgi:hypothetical protein
MVLSENDARLFYRLMWPLQLFVNKRLELIPNCPTVKAYQNLKVEQKLKVRDALYKNIKLVDEFVKENPERFNDEELQIIKSWRKFIAGEFFVERYLKRYAILIKGQSVYAVLGLFDPLEFSIGREELPAYIKTVLLPFRGRIIYDGLFQTHQIFFGSGITSDLREIYLTAKQNNGIVESLEADIQHTGRNKPRKPGKDWTTRVDALRVDARELSSGAGAPTIQGPVFSLVKASLEMAHVSVHDPEDVEQLWEYARKTERALRKVFTTLKRAAVPREQVSSEIRRNL